MLFLTTIFIAACSTTHTSKPWECSSNTPPKDAVVTEVIDGRHYYDCLWNGDGDGDGGGEGDGE